MSVFPLMMPLAGLLTVAYSSENRCNSSSYTRFDNNSAIDCPDYWAEDSDTFQGKYIAIGFGLMLLLIGGINYLSYQNVTRLSESTEKVEQTHDLLERLTNLLVHLHKAEAGRRGYVFFDDRLELERYDQSVQAIESNTIWF